MDHEVAKRVKQFITATLNNHVLDDQDWASFDSPEFQAFLEVHRLRRVFHSVSRLGDPNRSRRSHTAELATLAARKDSITKSQLEYATSIARQLEHYHINHAFVRGFVLSAQIWEDHRVRASQDIDLLVEAHKVNEVHAILAELGYAPDIGRLYRESSYRAEYAVVPVPQWRGRVIFGYMRPDMQDSSQWHGPIDIYFEMEYLPQIAFNKVLMAVQQCCIGGYKLTTLGLLDASILYILEKEHDLVAGRGFFLRDLLDLSLSFQKTVEKCGWKAVIKRSADLECLDMVVGISLLLSRLLPDVAVFRAGTKCFDSRLRSRHHRVLDAIEFGTLADPKMLQHVADLNRYAESCALRGNGFIVSSVGVRFRLSSTWHRPWLAVHVGLSKQEAVFLGDFSIRFEPLSAVGVTQPAFEVFVSKDSVRAFMFSGAAFVSEAQREDPVPCVVSSGDDELQIRVEVQAPSWKSSGCRARITILREYYRMRHNPGDYIHYVIAETEIIVAGLE